MIKKKSSPTRVITRSPSSDVVSKLKARGKTPKRNKGVQKTQAPSYPLLNQSVERTAVVAGGRVQELASPRYETHKASIVSVKATGEYTTP